MADISINLHEPALLTGPVIMLLPVLAKTLGLNEAIVYSQISFRLDHSTLKSGGRKVVRFSYSKLHAQMPFFSRRSLIDIISRLEEKETLTVIRDKRVNKYLPNNFSLIEEPDDYNTAKFLIFPELAKVIGLKEAILLQQIHLRHHLHDGHWWVVMPYEKWGLILSFMSLGAVKRTMANLIKLKLIHVKKHLSEMGSVNSYRVNYLCLASVLGIEVPIVKPGKSKSWVNPLHPINKGMAKAN